MVVTGAQGHCLVCRCRSVSDVQPGMKGQCTALHGTEVLILCGERGAGIDEWSSFTTAPLLLLPSPPCTMEGVFW